MPRLKKSERDSLALVDSRIEEMSAQLAETLQSLIAFMMVKRDITQERAAEALREALTPKLEDEFRKIAFSDQSSPPSETASDNEDDPCQSPTE